MWTTSIPSNADPILWNTLSYNCAPNTWKAALNIYGIVASSHTIVVEETKKFVKQQVLTNALDASAHMAYRLENSTTIGTY